MNTHEMTRVALATATLSVAVYMIPPLQLSFLPVPFTLQLMMVLFIALLLSPKEVVIALSIYLVLGAIGLPVFSGGRGGLSILLGPTGGFLWMFPVVGWLIARAKLLFSSTTHIIVVQIIAVYGVMYPVAVAWLAWQLEQSWIVTLLGMLSFLIVDGLKIVLVTLIYKHIPISLKTLSRAK